jgi:Xaa-Pro dipeptidase
MASLAPIPKLPTSLFRHQRARLAAGMKAALGGAASTAHHFAVFKGASEVSRGSSDTSYPFRQESYFQYFFGYEKEDCYGAVDLATGAGYLFVPRLPESYAVWMGRLITPSEAQTTTGVDGAWYVDELAAVLKEKGVVTVHVLEGTNSDSGLSPIKPEADKLPAGVAVEGANLFDVATRLRVIKQPQEVEFLRWLNRLSSAAHNSLLTQIRAGMNQRHILAAFNYFVLAYGGCTQLAYGAICATGRDSAILHYVENDRDIGEGEMTLLDLGAEKYGYASDITTNFPVSGKFTPVQAAIYNAVLEAHDAVVASMKAGVSWLDMHYLAMKVIGGHLRALDLVRGTDEELLQHEVVADFLPHGLGHLIGLEVHDVGGYMPGVPPRSTSRMANKLRTARVLEPGLFITVEPGLYFNAVLLEAAFKDPVRSKFFNEEKLRRPEFWNFGGVRIESNLVVSETGCENLTKVPRTVADIEAVMAGSKTWTV